VLCMLTKKQEEDIFSSAYHWRYEDNLSWDFVTGMVNQDLGTEYTKQFVKKICEKIKAVKEKS
jgi:asparagine synthetase A